MSWRSAPAKPSSFPVALYVRAQRKGATSAASEPVFTDIYFANANSFTSPGQDSVQVSRALELPPGDFEVTFAISEARQKTRERHRSVSCTRKR